METKKNILPTQAASSTGTDDHPPQPQKPQESDDDDDDDSLSAFIVKPIVSENQQPVNVKGGSSKRPAEIPMDKSKSKKSKVGVGKLEKGVALKWSEIDEDALLAGIIDYKAQTGNDVNSNVNAFFEYVKDLLSIAFTKTQLYEKVRRLKNKFQTNAQKWHNGELPVFSSPRENKLFDLSHKIWGSQGTVGGDDNQLSNTRTLLKTVTNSFNTEGKIKDFWSVYPRLCASLESEASGGYLTPRVENLKEYVKEMISAMGEEKATELEDGWKAIHVMDHQLYVKRAHLINKQAQAVLDSLT